MCDTCQRNAKAARVQKMKFPTLKDVDAANRELLARWYRFLMASTPEQQKVLKRIEVRFKKEGGMTPALSRKIGR